MPDKNQERFDVQTIAKIAVLFVISYSLLFLLGMFLYAWDSPMYFFPPIVGFFLAYFLVDWIDEFFETNAAHQWYFPVIILLLAFLAEYITLFWYYSNVAQMNGKQLQISFDSSSTQAASDVLVVFFVQKFKESAFLPFVLALILGWLAKIIIDQTKAGSGQ